MLTPFLLTQLIFEKPKYIKPIEQDIVASRPVEVLPKLELKQAEQVEVDYQYPVIQAVNTSGNLYDYLSCTWYVKEMRPDIPNSWGNATDWLYSAQAMGWATGTVPRAGAIGWTYGHVVYIFRVEGDQVYLGERNYDYIGSYRERYAPVSSFTYIY